jgi:hypothetical protein
VTLIGAGGKPDQGDWLTLVDATRLEALDWLAQGRVRPLVDDLMSLG